MQYSFNSNIRLEEHFMINVKKFPKRIAISCDGLDLTYEELDQKSNLIANLVKDNLDKDMQYVGL